MISTRKSFVIKALPLLLIMLSLSLVPTAFGLSAYSDPLIFEIQKGETQMLTWGIVNLGDEDIGIEFYATGEGSELLVFEKYDIVKAKSVKQLEVYVSIPKDHKDNIEFRPGLFALQRGIEGDEESSGMKFNIQMDSHPIIKIGNNPVYTEPKVADLPITPPKPEIKEVPKVEVKQEETLEEKMAKIQESNQPKEIIVDDVFEEKFEKEAVLEYVPEPEYELEPKDIVIPTEQTIAEETPGCGFIDWLLSLFGMAKC